jgi:hypothetical protein
MSRILVLVLFVLPTLASAGSWYSEVGMDAVLSEGREESLRSASAACQISVLEKLGWKISRTTGTNQIFYSEGEPCHRMNLADVHAEGGLTLQIPDSADESTLKVALPAVLNSKGSLCAYKFLVRSAAETTAAALDRNQAFRFYDQGWPYVKFMRPDYWQTGCSENGKPACFFPRVANTLAIGEFTQGDIATDCALGLQAAEYETLRVLFGDRDFNESFRAQEIVFAPWKTIHQTESATWGRLTNADSITDPSGEQTAELGALAFSGLSGYIGNVYGEAYLDAPIDRGENFHVLSLSLAAAAELRKRKGFEYFNRQNVRAFQLGRLLTPAQEELALTLKDPATLGVSEPVRIAFRELQAILASPVYRDFQTYVHPLGLRTLGEHIVRLLKVNPRTPYTIQLYPSRMNRGIFTRYVNAQLANCEN